MTAEADIAVRDLIVQRKVDAALKRLEQLRADALANVDPAQLEQVRDLTLEARMQATGKARERADRLTRSVDADLQFLRASSEPPPVEHSVVTAQSFGSLEQKERRQVTQAVAQGRVVDDPKLAPVAIVRAQQILDDAGDGWSLWRLRDWRSLLRAYRRQRIEGVAGLLLPLVVYAPLLLIAATRRFVIVLPYVAFHLALDAWVLDKFAREAPLRARQSKAANIHLIQDLRGRAL